MAIQGVPSNQHSDNFYKTFIKRLSAVDANLCGELLTQGIFKNVIHKYFVTCFSAHPIFF